MASVYEIIDKSVLPDEYLPDDYTGPSAGPLQKCIGKIFLNCTPTDLSIYASMRETCLWRRPACTSTHTFNQRICCSLI